MFKIETSKEQLARFLTSKLFFTKKQSELWLQLMWLKQTKQVNEKNK